MLHAAKVTFKKKFIIFKVCMGEYSKTECSSKQLFKKRVQMLTGAWRQAESDPTTSNCI